jgi:hypothetical protein
VFCGLGLVVLSLLAASGDLDMSIGFF